MIASDSSSSATSPPELDLLAGGRLPPLPTAFLEDRDRDLLRPLRYLPAGELPAGDPPPADRAELAHGLEIANAAYGHPGASRLAAKLADPATRVVVTGQQPGLYGGPLLTLSKMTAAVLYAEALEAAGQPAVAVFWVATEDHDWAEIAQASFLAGDGRRDLDLGADPSPLLPVGMRTFGPGLADLEGLIEDAGAAAGLEVARRWYRPDARFGEAFCRLMVHILRQRAPLMLDSMLAEVKRAQKPWLRRLVEERGVVGEALAAADAEVQDRGYALQVSPQPGLSPLFLLHGAERRRIEWRPGSRFGLRGVDDFSASVDDLLAAIDDNPTVVSPGVLARPAIQDAILGSTLQIMGPAELSYMSQVAPVYRVLGTPGPWTTLRPQALVIDDRHAGWLEELGMGLGEILGSEPLERLLTDKLDADVVAPVRRRIEVLMEELGDEVKALDRGLEGPWKKTWGHMGRGLDQLAAKVAAAVARRNGVWHRRLEQVRGACLPGGTFQERVLSVTHFIDRYGEGFAEAFAAQLGLDPRWLHVIRMSRGAP